MNVREHTWDNKNPSVSIDQNGMKYTWFERTPEMLSCKDNRDNEYCLQKHTGNLLPCPKGTIWPNWYRAYKDEVMQLINRAKSKVA